MSTDLLFGVFEFTVGVILVFIIANNFIEETNQDLIEENKLIAETFSNKESSYGFIYNDIIDEDKLSTLNHDQIKTELSLKNKFYIYFKDEIDNDLLPSLNVGTKPTTKEIISTEKTAFLESQETPPLKPFEVQSS